MNEEIANEEEVKANLLERDRIDSTRIESPLIQVDDAVQYIDTDVSPNRAMATRYYLGRPCEIQLKRFQLQPMLSAK